MARIPQQLQPPSKPLTVAETRAARRPVQRAVQRPLTQQQIQQQEELVKRKQAVVEVEKNISQWTKYLREREAEEKYLTEVAGKERDVGAEMRGVIERKQMAYKHLDQLKRAKVAAEAGVINASQVGTYVRETLEKQTRQTTRETRAAEFQQEVREAKKQVQAGGSGEFDYQGQDYVIEGGQVYGIQKTKAPEALIVKPSQVQPGQRVIAGYDTFGRPQYMSVDPSRLTPQERARTELRTASMRPDTSTVSKIDIYRAEPKPELSIKDAGLETLRRAKELMKEKFITRPTGEGYNLQAVLEPITQVGKPIEREETHGVPFRMIKRGTVSPGESYYETITPKDLTKTQQIKYRDVLKYATTEEGLAYQTLAQDISKNIQKDIDPKYQKQLDKLDKNKLTESEYINAESKIQKDYQKEFEEKYTKKYDSQSNKLRELRKTTPGLKRTGEEVYETAVFGAGMAVAVIPILSSITGYARDTAREKTETAKIEITKSGTFSQYPYVKPDVETTMYFAFAGLGAGGALRSTEKAIIKEELKQLSEQPIKATSYLIPVSETEYKVVQRGVQTFGRLKTEVDITGKVISQKGGRYLMPIGEGEARTTGTLSWNIMGGGTPTKIMAIQQFETGSFGSIYNLGKGVTGSLGRETIIPTASTGVVYQTKTAQPYMIFPSPKVRYQGASTADANVQAKRMVDQLTGNLKIGGDIIKEDVAAVSKRIKPDEFLTVSGKVEKIGVIDVAGREEVAVEFIAKEFGKTKIIKPPVEDTGIKFFRSTGGTKTPLSKTFGEIPKPKEVVKAPPKTPKAPITISEEGLKSIIKLPAEKVTSMATKSIPAVTERGIISGVFMAREDLTTAPKDENRFKSLGVAGTRFDTGIDEKDRTKTTGGLKSPSATNLGIKDDQIIFSRLAQPQRTDQLTKQKQDLRPLQVSPTPSTSRAPTIGIPGLGGLGFPITFPGERAYNKEDQTGYHAYVKEKGKYIKVSNKPMTRQGAKSIGARYVDNTVSATFRIEPIKETRTVRGKKVDQVKVFKEDELQKGSGYFNKASNKFRDYMVRKGNQVQMNNKWIERQGKRADTSGEQKGLTVAKYRATVQKKRAGVPTRKSKGRNVKSFFGM